MTWNRIAFQLSSNSLPARNGGCVLTYWACPVRTLYDFFVESGVVEGRLKMGVERDDLKNFLNWMLKSHYFSDY